MDYHGQSRERRILATVEQLWSDSAGITAENGEINLSSDFLSSQRQWRSPPIVRAFGDIREKTMQFAFGHFYRCWSRDHSLPQRWQWIVEMDCGMFFSDATQFHAFR